MSETTPFGDGGEMELNDWSVLAGISMEYALNSHILVLDVRYLHDMTDWRTVKNGLNNDPQIRNRTLIFSLGISL